MCASLFGGKLPVSAKCQVARACISSRALIAAGTWPSLSPTTWAKLRHTIMAPVRGSIGQHVPMDAYPMISDAAVCQRARCPASWVQLVVARLCYFCRVVQHAPPSLIALLQCDVADEWKEETLIALRALQDIVRPQLDHLHELEHFEHFVRVNAHSSMWNGLIKRVEKHAAKEEPSAWTAEMPAPTAVFQCSDCSREFTSRKALKCHQSRVHGARRPAYFVAGGSICPACGANFHSRTRLMAHLQWGKASCVAALREGFLPAVPDEQLSQALVADRAVIRAARVSGAWKSSGPPAEPPACGWRRDCD